jgi:hypothetical protein
MIEILFLLGFSLHNLEEAVWLPSWSVNAGRFHKRVSKNEFYFAVIVVTIIGYLLTFQYFIFGASSMANISRFAYLGFILMMVVNVIFPHLAATISLKRYAPGTMTGLLLNAPMGIYILTKELLSKQDIMYTAISGIVITVTVLFLINISFKIGKRFD